MFHVQYQLPEGVLEIPVYISEEKVVQREIPIFKVESSNGIQEENRENAKHEEKPRHDLAE